MSLLIKNGRIITAVDDYHADIFVENETVSVIGKNLDMDADTVIDAQGKYVFPGGLDPHTHMDMPFGGATSADDFETGTRAAAHGGTTTIVDFATTYNPIPELDFYYSYTREQKDWEHLFETKLRRGKLELAYRFIWSEDHEPDKEERENLLILSYKIPL